MENLQALCTPHHNKKSSREGTVARQAKRSRYTFAEEHPSFALARKLKEQSE